MPANDALMRILRKARRGEGEKGKTFAPDPLNAGMFKEVGREEQLRVAEAQLRVGCQWCRGSYAEHRDNCPNCGAPNQPHLARPRAIIASPERGIGEKYALPKPITTTEYR